MSPEKLAKLTEKEREALRLVHRRLTSKEIAPLLGIRVDAVDARIKNATRKLGIPDRGKAALFLAEHESEGTYQRLVYPPPEIAATNSAAMFGEPVASTLKEGQAPFFLGEEVLAAVPSGAAKSEDEERVKLTSWQRIGLIVAVAIGTIVALGVLVSALNGLVQLVLVRGRIF